MDAVEELIESDVPISSACHALGVSRATFYRDRRPPARDAAVIVEPAEAQPSRPSHRALSDEERAEVLGVLHSKDFVDSSPRQVYATLLEKSVYLCSPRTMYRILDAAGELGERRDQRTHPCHEPPSLQATGPKQVWTWDITKLKGPTRWTYFHLYVILDIFSRYVVGWMVADREDSELAKKLIQTTCERQGIAPDRLTLHADRGPSMTSKTVAQLLTDLGVDKSHSRPRVSNDNAYSESQFKTLKYQPNFPGSFESIEHAREHLSVFFDGYNYRHKHSGLATFSPATVHHGQIEDVLRQRQAALDDAYTRVPERFAKPPVAKAPPRVVYLGPQAAEVIVLAAGEPVDQVETKQMTTQEAL